MLRNVHVIISELYLGRLKVHKMEHSAPQINSLQLNRSCIIPMQYDYSDARWKAFTGCKTRGHILEQFCADM